MRSNVFNGIQPSNVGCTNGAIFSGQVTIDCGQGTTLIDCDRGYNYSDYFIWSRTASVAQQVSIVFRFDQQISISKISMFFWNSQSNSIIVPNVRMYQSNRYVDDIIISNEITQIASNSPNRTGDGRYRLNFDFIGSSTMLRFQYLRVELRFYTNSQWIFLSEAYFCGE